MQVALDKMAAEGYTAAYLPHGDYQLSDGLLIPDTLRKVEGRGTCLIVPRRMDDVGLLFRRQSGFAVRDIELRDVSGQYEPGSAPAVRFQGCSDFVVSNMRVTGFGGGVVFAHCTDFVLDASRFVRSAGWNVYLHDCSRFRIINTVSDEGWTDGFKLAGGTNSGSLISCSASRNGRVVESDPNSNGNGIDTYNSTHHVKLIDFFAEGNRGANINIKGGPKDDGAPASYITVINPTCRDATRAGLDINSASNRHVSIPHHVHVIGGTFANNATQDIRVGRCSDGSLSGPINAKGAIWIDPACHNFQDHSIRY